jgi:hypothetical protein
MAVMALGSYTGVQDPNSAVTFEFHTQSDHKMAPYFHVDTGKRDYGWICHTFFAV